MAKIVQCVVRKIRPKECREQEGDSVVLWVEKDFAVAGSEIEIEGNAAGWYVSHVYRLRTVEEHNPQYPHAIKTKVRRPEFKLT